MKADIIWGIIKEVVAYRCQTSSYTQQCFVHPIPLYRHSSNSFAAFHLKSMRHLTSFRGKKSLIWCFYLALFCMLNRTCFEKISPFSVYICIVMYLGLLGCTLESSSYLYVDDCTFADCNFVHFYARLSHLFTWLWLCLQEYTFVSFITFVPMGCKWVTDFLQQ